MKSTRIRSSSGSNVGKYGPEELRIRTLFTQDSIFDIETEIAAMEGNIGASEMIYLTKN